VADGTVDMMFSLCCLPQVFMKSVKLEWCLGDIPKAKDLLTEAVKHYPGFPKVIEYYLMCMLCFV
jgi:hypothetical protein